MSTKTLFERVTTNSILANSGELTPSDRELVKEIETKLESASKRAGVYDITTGALNQAVKGHITSQGFIVQCWTFCNETKCTIRWTEFPNISKY